MGDLTASLARGMKLQARFDRILKDEVAAHLRANGWRRAKGVRHWNRVTPPGRVDTFDLEMTRGQHPEFIEHTAMFGVHLAAIEAYYRPDGPALAKITHAREIALARWGDERTHSYVFNHEVDPAALAAEILGDIDEALDRLAALDETDLESVLAWDPNPQRRAVALAAFGDLDGARSAYPRSQARAFDDPGRRDPVAARLGLDPAWLPPPGGYQDDGPIAARLHEAFGDRFKMARGLGDEVELTIPGPITATDRATAEAIAAPHPVRFNQYGMADDSFARSMDYKRRLEPLLLERERMVPDLVACAKGTSGQHVTIEVVNLDAETESLIRSIVPDEHLELREAAQPALARLERRDRHRRADSGGARGRAHRSG